jgi:RimJ/RimL family protein N-acetyltransferase
VRVLLHLTVPHRAIVILQATSEWRKQMTPFTAPAQPLTDGVVTLRLPSAEAGDVDAVLGYIEQGQLDGGWLPEVPLVPAEQAIGDWVDAWTHSGSRNGPTFVLTVAGEARFVGIVGMVDRGEGIVELIYGIAPRWRGRGLACRGVQLAARWAASQSGVNSVELRIDQDMIECQHVAIRAGFAPAGTVTQFVPGTGETFEDLRYVLAPAPGSPVAHHGG